MKQKIYFLFISVLILSGCAQRFPAIQIPNTEPSGKKIDQLRPRIVLVLGSGSARGFAHAGILKVLERNHIPIDLIVGTSAGSIVGALYADNPSSKSLEHLLLTTRRREIIDFSLFNIVRGPISGAGLQNFLVRNLRAKSFDQLKIPFIAVATDLELGKSHAFKSGPIIPAVNASSAVAPFFPPVKLYGRTYVDGGFTAPIAVNVARKFHPKIIIAVKLDFPLSKTLPSNSLDVFLRSLDIVLLKLHKTSIKGANIVISPKLNQVGMFQVKDRVALMKAGELAAEKVLPDIIRLCKIHSIKISHPIKQ